MKTHHNKRANTGSEFPVASTIANCKNLESNEIDYSQGFSQKVVSTRLCVLKYGIMILLKCEEIIKAILVQENPKAN